VIPGVTIPTSAKGSAGSSVNGAVRLEGIEARAERARAGEGARAGNVEFVERVMRNAEDDCAM